MIRRSLLVAIGLAAVICLGGCVVHGHGHTGVHTRTHHTRVYNVTQKPDPVHHDHGSHEGSSQTRHPYGKQNHHGTHGDNGKHKGYDKHRDLPKHKVPDHDD